MFLRKQSYPANLLRTCYNKTMNTRHITWNALAWNATETCVVASDDTGVRVEGHLSGRTEDDQPFEMSYLLELAPDWSVQHVLIKDVRDEGNYLDLVREDGRWLDHDGIHLTDFDSCEFVDLNRTPLTNSLPIKKLRFEGGDPVVIDVLCIDMPALTMSRKSQAYTQLGAHTYRFQEPGFTADIVTDDNDLVAVYPDLFVAA